MTPGKDTLGRKVLNAGGWSVVQIFTTQLFRLASNLIMTRLLLPDAFGLMAMVSTLLIAINLFSDVGIQRSIIREPDGDTPHFLRVAWTINILRGLIIAAVIALAAVLLWLLAPDFAPEGTVYADPRLPGLILLSALQPILQAMNSTNRDLTSRRLENRRFVTVGILAQMFSISCMIGFAQISPTVWALMVGMLMSGAFLLVSSHLVFPGPRMRLEWDAEIADRLWRFGKYLMGSSTFTFFASNADKIILASLLSAPTFGLYVIAQVWIGATRQLISSLISRVGFAAMGEIIRQRVHDLPRLYWRFQKVIDVICLSGFLFCLFLGQWLIDLLYTSTYSEAGHYLRLMSPALLVLRFEPLGNLLVNLGNSRAMMLISGIRAISLIVLLYPAYLLFGIEGAVVVAVLSPLLTVPYILSLTAPHLGTAQTRVGWAWMGSAVLAMILTLLMT